ncbi:uncharacterized [Tachysurus ichikawai]
MTFKVLALRQASQYTGFHRRTVTSVTAEGTSVSLGFALPLDCSTTIAQHGRLIGISQRCADGSLLTIRTTAYFTPH